MNLFNFQKKQVQAMASQLKYLTNENAQLQAMAQKYNEVFFQYMNGVVIFQKDTPQNYVIRGYQQNEDVYSIVSKIAMKAAMAPVILYEIKDEKALKQYNTMKKGNTLESKFNAMQLQKKALKEVSSNLLLDVWEDPNPFESNFEFQMKAYIFLLICGNQFFYGTSGTKKGVFNQLHSLPAHLTQIVGGNTFNPIKGYKCMWSGTQFDFEPSEVKHVKYPGFDYDQSGGHLYGQSPLRVSIKNTISRMISANEEMLRQMQNAGALGFVSNENDKYALNPDQTKALEDKMMDRLKSEDAYRRFLVSNGALKWNQIGFSSIDLDLLPIAKFDQVKIANIYGYPIQLYNSESASTDNNMKWAAKNYINNVIAPLHHQIDDALNKFFVAPYAKMQGKRLYIEHDIWSYPEVQEDMGDLTKWLDMAWWLSPNEKREMQRFGRSEDLNMDKIFIPSNLMDLDSATLSPADFNLNN